MFSLLYMDKWSSVLQSELTPEWFGLILIWYVWLVLNPKQTNFGNYIAKFAIENKAAHTIFSLTSWDYQTTFFKG